MTGAGGRRGSRGGGLGCGDGLGRGGAGGRLGLRQGADGAAESGDGDAGEGESLEFHLIRTWSMCGIGRFLSCRKTWR